MQVKYINIYLTKNNYIVVTDLTFCDHLTIGVTVHG